MKLPCRQNKCILYPSCVSKNEITCREAADIVMNEITKTNKPIEEEHFIKIWDEVAVIFPNAEIFNIFNAVTGHPCASAGFFGAVSRKVSYKPIPNNYWWKMLDNRTIVDPGR